MNTNSLVLEVQNLKCHFSGEKGLIKAVDGVSFTVRENEIVCLIGESGSGKSVTALSLLGLVNGSPGIIGGSINFNRTEILSHRMFENQKGDKGSGDHERFYSRVRKDIEKRFSPLRSFGKIAIIFQDPLASLDPLYTVEKHYLETLLQNKISHGKKAARQDMRDILKKMGFNESIETKFPSQLSGGECQRIMIGLAYVMKPILLIADEPTTALDSVTQKSILTLIKELKDKYSFSMLLITHDVALTKKYADKVVVMYAGEVVELGTKDEVFDNHFRHPYTDFLIRHSNQKMDSSIDERISELNPPDPSCFPTGCRFHPRCTVCTEFIKENNVCVTQEPPLIRLNGQHQIKCWIYVDRKMTIENAF